MRLAFLPALTTAVLLFVGACGDDDTDGDNNNQNNNNQAYCGDGIKDPGEQCDDGEANSDTEPDACRADCRLPWCGDGVADTREECDDGNGENEDGCLTACIGDSDCCVANVCGDGYVDRTPAGGGWQVEACDDGVNDGTVCRQDCGQDMTLCGDGEIDQGEGCDLAGMNSDTRPDACRTNCQPASCGDGVQDSEEVCVEQVNWHGAAAFCNALSDAAGMGRCYECTGAGTWVTCHPSAAYATPYDCPGRKPNGRPGAAAWAAMWSGGAHRRQR